MVWTVVCGRRRRNGAERRHERHGGRSGWIYCRGRNCRGKWSAHGFLLQTTSRALGAIIEGYGRGRSLVQTAACLNNGRNHARRHVEFVVRHRRRGGDAAAYRRGHCRRFGHFHAVDPGRAALYLHGLVTANHIETKR